MKSIVLMFLAIFIGSAAAQSMRFSVEINDKPANYKVEKINPEGTLRLTFEDGYSLTVRTTVEKSEQRYYFKVIDQPEMLVYNDVGGSATYAFRNRSGTIYRVVAELVNSKKAK